MTTTKVFQSGNSQAVRIPREFQFDVAEVEIERHGDEIILHPQARICRQLSPHWRICRRASLPKAARTPRRKLAKACNGVASPARYQRCHPSSPGTPLD
jgi:virulence-associated protein VagC